MVRHKLPYISYSYTRLGHMKNPEELENIIEDKNVTIKFEQIKIH